jgi:hypothetical protein
MLTGMREAIRAFHMLRGEDAFGRTAAALVEKDAVRKRKKASTDKRPVRQGYRQRFKSHMLQAASVTTIKHVQKLMAVHHTQMNREVQQYILNS